MDAKVGVIMGKLTGGPITRKAPKGKAGKEEYKAISKHAKKLKALRNKQKTSLSK